MLYVEGGGLSRGAGMIKLEGIHFISHAFIQSCELTLVRISCPSHAEKKNPMGKGTIHQLRPKYFRTIFLHMV